MSNDKQPEIRFPGFTEDWEQRKLGEVVERVTRKNKKLESIRPLTISAQEGLIDQNEFFNKTVASRDVSGYYLVKKGEFAYNKSYSNGYPWGAVKRLNQYDMGVLSTLYIVFKPKKIDSDFLEKYYDTTYWYKEVSKHAAEGARNHGLLNIAASDFFETEIVMPLKIEEQQKIGAFFKQLDDTIALHQRKLDLLKETKKGFLQKMFPKNGAKVPEIRFPGFTGDWEQRKLGDVLTVSKEKNKSNSYSKEQILSVSREVGTVNQIEYQGRSFAGADISGYKIVYPGQLIYTKSPLKGAPYGIFQLVTEEGIVSPLYAVYNSTEQALASFIGLQLKSDNIATHYLSPLVSKGAKNTINITDEGALDGRVTYPTITEQQKIVAFFKQLENTITLHQRKLDLLKETKKGFLQKMFV
ncbi:TPA: restriction endonuclease subunit S [Enterococcus hirae]